MYNFIEDNKNCSDMVYNCLNNYKDFMYMGNKTSNYSDYC